MDIVHFQPLLRRQNDDSVELIRDFPSRAKSQHEDVDQQNKHVSGLIFLQLMFSLYLND